MEACSGTVAATYSRAPASLRDTCDHDPCEGPHPEDDEGEEDRSFQPAETAGWEDAIAVMARGASMVPDLPAESSLRSFASTASMKVKNVKKLALTKGHFPRLAECAHFHYENVDFGSVQLSLAEDQNDLTQSGFDSKEAVYLVQICCQGRKWIVKRSYEEFRVLDKHLHLCIYDRNFSQLPELPRVDILKDKGETLFQMLTAYISRFSAIADNKINCGPVLTWMEIDNKGNHLLVHDESSINVPAVAAAHVIKRYTAQAADELSFEVGDIVSVIDMPPKDDTGWWRGKHGFQVGFFPSECVELISEKIPSNVTNALAKPVSKKHGKLITFLRTFMKSRPTKQKLKQRGILKERVFGCDLGEHLLNSGHDVPQVIRSCTEFIERHGVVDGIYRLSGISSNIQKLRHEFDSEDVPDLTKDTYVQDIHSVGSLCKLYFRELPNPLLTYQLYEKFSDAVSAATDEERLIKVHDVIQQLPPPHYRTLEFLMRHLSCMATFSTVTNMHCKNIAIVWAPNLLRSKQIESACFSGTSAFMEVRVQSVVVEFILNHVDALFSPKLSTLIRQSTGHATLARPKSLLVSSPSTKLLSLEEAQARTQAQLNSPVSPDSKYIDVGEGPAALQGKFHTVIDFPSERKKGSTKSKKSPVGNWLSFFNMGKSSAPAKPKLQRHPSEPNEMKTTPLPGGRRDTGTLRSAKSEESLSSSHNFEGGSNVYRPRRPLSTSDALSISFNEELLDSRVTGDSRFSLKDLKKDTDASSSCVPALISPPHPAVDSEFIGIASSDIDPLAFKSSMQPTDPSVSDGKKKGSRKKAGGSVIETKPLDKVTSPSLPPDLIPVRFEDTNHNSSKVQAAPAKLEVGTSKTGQEGPTRSSVAKTVTKSCPSDMTSLMKKPSVSSKSDRGHHRSASFCKAESKSANVKEHRRTESGTVTFECTPGLVRSVSLITPQPAVKNAARMLALELAESAQQATRQSKRGSSEPPTPVSPVHHHNTLFTLQFPPHHPLQTSSDREEQYVARTFPDPSSTMSTESHTDAGSLRSTCACHGSESGLSFSDGCDACTHVPPQGFSPRRDSDTQLVSESHTAMRENIRHVGVGTDGGVSSQDDKIEVYEHLQPSERFSEETSLDSQSAIEALHNKQAANAANFRAILAETAVPASVHEVLPQASPPPSVVYQYQPVDKRSAHSQHWSSPIRQSTPSYQPDDGHPLPRVLSRNYCNTLAPRSLHQSIKYKGQREEYSSVGLYKHSGPRYPPLDGASVYPTIRRVRSMHAPPEDKFYLLQHQGSQYKPYPKPPPSDIRPYFEDGKVRYRYSPYSEARYKKVDQHRENSQGYTLSYTLSKLPSRPSKVMGGTEHYRKPQHNLPLNNESDFMTRDVGLQPRTKNPPLYETFNSGLSDRHFSQSIRRESSAKERSFGPVLPQPHVVRSSRQCQETMHSRSRSNSGKEMLISTEGADGKYRVTMVSHYSPEHTLSDPDMPTPHQSDRYGGGQGARSAYIMKQSRSMHNYSSALPRNPTLTLHKEYSCPDFKHTGSSDSYKVTHPNQDRLVYNTLRNSSKEDYRYIWGMTRESQKSKRSQSVKTRHPPAQTRISLEQNHRQSFSSQNRTRTRSMHVPSRSDYSESYVSVHAKVPKTSRAGSGAFPNYGCMPLHNNRLYCCGPCRVSSDRAQARDADLC